MKRILIIDDEERIREILRACIEDLGGWEAIVANSGSEGLVKAEAESLDAILLDVSMPDMDGFNFFDRLQENHTTRNIPVIFLTARVMRDDREQLNRVRVAGTIAKPFNPVMLCQQVAKILGWN